MKNILKIISKSLILSCIIYLLVPAAFADDDKVAIIVNKNNPQSLTQQQIKNIYSDIVTHWENGKKISVLNLPVDSPAREKFSQNIFGETAQQIAADELNRKITNAVKNPSKIKRARLLVKKVSRDINAIGYVPASTVNKKTNARIVLQID